MVDLKEIQKQMDEMEKSVEVPSDGFEDFRTDPPGTEAPGTSAPGTESLSTDAPGTQAPGTTTPGTPAPSTDAPTEDPRDAELRALREEIENLKKPKTTKAPSTSAPSTEAPLADEDFLGDLDLDDLTRDKSLFNQILNKVHKKGIELGRADSRKAVEQLIRSIPDITKNTIAIETQLKEVNRKFYEDNKDLIPWKKSVATVFEEMIAKDPSKRYDEILPDVAGEVRKRLGLQKSADNKDNPPPPPKKGGKGKRQSQSPDLSKFEKELDEMDRALEL